jgi:hypothetical protein
MRARRFLAALAAFVAVLFVLASPALAQVAPDGNVSPDAPVSAYLTINNMLVLMATGTLVPIINGLLLRPSNPTIVKILVANLFATAVHALSQVIQADGTAVLSQEWLLGLGMTLLTMTAAYFGIWAPLDINAKMPTPVPVGDLLEPLARAA